MIHYGSGSTNLVLDSGDTRQQSLAVTASEVDVTHEVTWSAEPSGIVRIDKSGRVTPVTDGAAVIFREG